MSTTKRIAILALLLITAWLLLLTFKNNNLIGILSGVCSLTTALTAGVIRKAKNNEVWDLFYSLTLWPVKYLFVDLIGNTVNFFTEIDANKDYRKEALTLAVIWAIWISSLAISKILIGEYEGFQNKYPYYLGLYLAGWVFGFLNPNYIPTIKLDVRTIVQGIVVGSFIGLA